MSAKRYEGIDYEWRPEGYRAAPASPLDAALRNVKGTNRRQLILDFAAADIAEGVDPVLLQQSLSPEQRKGLGMIHPSFMGGEYLPDYLENEVEIARIELQSTTGDVISIRARPIVGNRIAYRIVDEYEDDYEGSGCLHFAFAPQESTETLALGALVDLIDGAQHDPEECYYGRGLGLCYNEALTGHYPDIEELRHFTTVSSDIYPQLFEHYDRVHEDWVEEVNRERAGDEWEGPDQPAPGERPVIPLRDGDEDKTGDAASDSVDDEEDEICRQLALNLAVEFHMKPKMIADPERRKRDEPA